MPVYREQTSLPNWLGSMIATSSKSTLKSWSMRPLILLLSLSLLAAADDPVIDYLLPNEEWELVSEGHNYAEGLACASDGTLYFTDVRDSELYQITPNGSQILISDQTGKANGIALSSDEKTLYLASNESQEIRSYHIPSKKWEVLTKGTHANDLVVTKTGHLYYTDPKGRKVWHVQLDTKERQAADLDFAQPNGIGLSPDHHFLYVAHFPSDSIYRYQIEADGSLTGKKPFFKAQLNPDNPRGLLDGMTSAANGELVIGTQIGAQILSREGPAKLVIPSPNEHRCNYVTFGGLERRTLYGAFVSSIYKRKLNLKGASN